MRFTSLISTMVCGVALAGCSAFEPDYYNCENRVTSYAEGARSSIITDDESQNVEVRFNGVSARCYDSGNIVNVELGIGLKVTRDLGEGAEVSPVTVPMISAKLDNNDEVLSTDSFIYTMQFRANVDQIYPLVRREMVMPQGGRIILSLTPELLSN